MATRAFTADLPDYADMLAARHRAHAEHLRTIVAEMPLTAGHCVVDLGCGDGSWTAWLAERVGRAGHVVGIDRNEGYLALARRTLGATRGVSLLCADATDVPLPDGSVDAVVCAHGLYSFDDTAAVLAEARRLVRLRGAFCLVSADVLRHVQLPWPPALELDLESALHRALSSTGDRRPFLPRRAARLVANAGLAHLRHETFTLTRTGPLSPDDARYLRGWIATMVDMAGPHLSPPARDAVLRWTHHDRLRHPTFTVTYTDQLTVGRCAPSPSPLP